MRGILLAALAAALPLAAEPLCYVIDLADPQQVIDHFGANDAWSFQKIGAWSEANKNRIADLLYTTDKGIGLSFCRFQVGGGINHTSIKNDWRTADTFEVAAGKYDWTRLPGERWFLRAAKARGVQHFGMTIYSPPMRLTRNGLTNHGTDTTSSTNLKPGGESSFAEYLTDMLVHFRDNPDAGERIEFDRIFPHNEPMWDWQGRQNQEGNRASNEDIRRVHLALQSALRAEQLRTLIAGPESGSIPGMYELNAKALAKWHAEFGNYLKYFGDDAQLARGLGGVMTYHSYWSDRLAGQLVAHRQELGKALAARPNWKLWQSEYCVMEWGRDLTIDTALRVARVIHCDLTLANASSWQWWLAVANEDFKSGLIYTDYQKPGDPENILESKTLWALGNFSRFIRPGMRRVGMRGGEQNVEGLMASSYLDQPNKRVVTVFVNEGRTSCAVRLALARGGRVAARPLIATPHTTSARENLAVGTTVDATQGLEIPARSVVTLVSVP